MAKAISHMKQSGKLLPIEFGDHGISEKIGNFQSYNVVDVENRTNKSVHYRSNLYIDIYIHVCLYKCLLTLAKISSLNVQVIMFALIQLSSSIY